MLICFVQRGLPLQSLQVLPNLASSAPAFHCICHYHYYSFVNISLYEYYMLDLLRPFRADLFKSLILGIFASEKKLILGGAFIKTF